MRDARLKAGSALEGRASVSFKTYEKKPKDVRVGDLSNQEQNDADSNAPTINDDINQKQWKPTSAELRIESISEADSGNYTCRVDFRLARTRMSMIELKVIGK